MTIAKFKTVTEMNEKLYYCGLTFSLLLLLFDYFLY